MEYYVDPSDPDLPHCTTVYCTTVPVYLTLEFKVWNAKLIKSKELLEHQTMILWNCSPYNNAS